MSVVLVLLCLAASFILAGTEAGLMAVSRVRVRHAASEGDRKAVRLLPMLQDRDAMLGAVTVVNHVFMLAAFLLLAKDLVDWLQGYGYLVAFGLGLPVFLIGLEIVPKKLFRSYPFRFLKFSLPVLCLVAPLRSLFRDLLRHKKDEPDISSANHGTREDLKAMVSAMRQKGQIHKESEGLIRGILDYRKLRVMDLMLPLRRSVALAPDIPVHVAMELARVEQLESVAVLGEDGAFIGLFEPALCPAQLPQDQMVRQYMRTLEEVREDELALRALQRLRKRGRSMALVMSAEKVPIGVVSEEALLQPMLRLR